MNRLPLMRSCREVTTLLIAREDRPLRPLERWAVRLHLPMCSACQRMQGQIRTLRQALQQWRQEGENPPSSRD
jgi:predicted anti-sigma-YlaC factor YlaD